MDRQIIISLRRSRLLLLLAATGLAGMAAAQSALPPISPRLFSGEAKAVGGAPAVLIPAEGRQLPALPGSQIMADGSVLARLTQTELEQLAASGNLGWAMPQQPVLLPDDMQAEPAGSDGAVSKAFGPIPGEDGHGITVGLIDFGTIDPANPALQRVVAQRRMGPTATTRHVDKVLQLAFAKAPGASYFVALLPASPTEQDVIEAARWLASRGARIINFSGASYGDRRDGTAPLDRLADELAARDILFVTSAGNEARRSWAGPLVDRDGDGFLDLPQGGLMLDVRGGDVLIQLSWDDWQAFWTPFPNGRHDLDLQLLTDDGRLIRQAHTGRGLRGEPVESIGPVRLAAGVYRLRLPVRSRGSGQPLVQIVATGSVSRMIPAVAASSIAIPGTGRSTLTVGARALPRGAAMANYSGRGPTLDNRQKPEVLSVGNAPGSDVGTSYAAPRIAGLAARLWSANPQMPLAALRAAVLRHASTVVD